jgi:hypothetical protein
MIFLRDDVEIGIISQGFFFPHKFLFFFSSLNGHTHTISILVYFLCFPDNIFQISTPIYTKFNLSNIEIH